MACLIRWSRVCSLAFAIVWLWPSKAQGGITQWSGADLVGKNVRALAVDGSFVYASVQANSSFVSEGVFVTSNGGTSWMPLNDGLTDLSVNSLLIVDVPRFAPCPSPCLAPLFAGTNQGGVFRRLGQTLEARWEAANNGLTNLSISSLAYSSFRGSLYAGTSGGIFKSNDLGTTWAPVGPPVPPGSFPQYVLTLATVPNSPVVFAGTDYGSFKSSDGGATWTAVNVNPVNPRRFHATTFAIDPRLTSTIYAAGFHDCAPAPCGIPPESGFYRSSDSGTTWNRIGSIGSGLTNPFVTALMVSSSGPSVVWAGTGGGGVFESSDGGDSWRAVNSGLGSMTVRALVTAPEPLVESPVGAAVYAGTFNGVYRAIPDSGGCTASATSLCLNASRFLVSVAWRDSTGASVAAQALPITSISGAFSFFDRENLEVVVKILDGRPVNGNWWVISGALSDLEYTIAIIDTETGAVRTYFNPRGRIASFVDLAAF